MRVEVGSPQSIDRRQSSRVRIFGDLSGRLVPIDELVVLRDIGLGGFAVESTAFFATGAAHTFELTAPSGRQLLASATLRQCVPQADFEALPYLSSFVFAPASSIHARAISEFVREFARLPHAGGII
jgi:hypothetical protein